MNCNKLLTHASLFSGIGGFSCQPFSLAGKRKGAADDRYLWPAMLDIIRKVRPTWIIGENIIRIASMALPGTVTKVENETALQFEDHQVIDRICENLEQAGYSGLQHRRAPQTRPSVVQQDGFKGNARLGYGSFNTLQSEVSGRYRKKGFSSIVTGSYNRSDGHRARMGFEQYGGYAKVGYEFSQNWNLFADVNITHFNASNPGMESRPIYDNDSKITRGMTSFSLENNYERTSGALKFFYNWGHHNINDGYYEGGTPRDFLFNSKDQMLGLTWYQSASLFKGNRVTVGIDYQLFGGNAWNAFLNGTTTEIADKTEDNLAAYFDFRQSLGQIITLDAGVRVDHHSITGTHLIPQFGASIYPTKTGEIKLLASRGFRNPTIREMYMFPPQNPDLKSESLWNYELSWSQRLLQGKLSYGINLFYINGENMIQTVPVDGRPLNINTGKIENWGAELSASYRISEAFSVMANYSYLHMENAVLAAPEHKLYAGVDFTKGRWSASTGVQYVAGLYTSISEDATTQENFVLWNLRGVFRATKWLELFAKGENLLNHKYEINLVFPMPGATVMGGVNINF